MRVLDVPGATMFDKMVYLRGTPTVFAIEFAATCVLGHDGRLYVTIRRI